VLRHLRRTAGPRPAALLDVGAQTGALAVWAARLGYSVAAVDYERYARRFAAIVRPHGVDYRACDVGREPLPFPAARFDFVTYLDVIEHHAFAPTRVLREIHRVLRPGGQVVILTPHHASLANRVSLLVGRSVHDDIRAYLDGGATHAVYQGHHREYTRRDLRYALMHSGYVVRACRAIEEDPRSLVRAARHGGAGATARRWLDLAAAVLGKTTEWLHLPFGRVLWAVGEKPQSENSATTGA
jgi:SAM-dependent methyltransferase